MLLCDDVTAMTAFYRDVIGLAVDRQVPGRYTEFRIGMNVLALRGPSRTYDWRNAVVRDSNDMLFRSDLMLIFKHKNFGGLAPMMQIMNYSLGNERFTQLNYGFALATRPGFRRANDIFFVQFLFHPGSTFGSYDSSEAYGNHLLF